MIDYNALSAETWEKSSFRKKNAALLIIFYEHDPDKAPLDLRINSICTWELPPEDFEIIRDDWEKIAQKARESRAHTLSESDTRYLAASTKGATGAQRRSQFGTDERAKPRAFSLKQGYLRYIFEKVVLGLSTTAPLPKASRKKNLETWVSEQFASYKGMTAAEIAKTLKLTLSPRAKGFHASITRSILGIAPDKEIEEFQKAEICCRTVRLQRNGNLSEYISFPAFDPKELVGQDWDTSDFRNQVVKRFMFVIYKADGRGAHRFEGVRFWSMPKQDLEQARQVWIETVKRLKGRSRSLPKKSESRVAHVRPHGRNSRDTFETPGGKMTKQSFWLNGDYIAEQLGLYRRKRKTGTKKRKRES
jgi:DNA mismatch repair protein MutH